MITYLPAGYDSNIFLPSLRLSLFLSLTSPAKEYLSSTLKTHKKICTSVGHHGPHWWYPPLPLVNHRTNPYPSMLLRSLGRTKNGEKCWTCAPVGEGRSLGMDTGALLGWAVGLGRAEKSWIFGFLCLDKRDLLMLGGGETKNVKWGI